MNAVNSDNVDQMLALAKMLNVRKEFEVKYLGKKEDHKIFGKVRCDKLLLSAIEKLTKNDIERNIQVSNVMKEVIKFEYPRSSAFSILSFQIPKLFKSTPSRAHLLNIEPNISLCINHQQSLWQIGQRQNGWKNQTTQKFLLSMAQVPTKLWWVQPKLQC